MGEQTQSSEVKRFKVRPIIWAVGFAALCLAYLVGSVVFELNHEPHDHTLRPETQIRSICQALIIYAGDHKDQFPEQDRWGEELVEARLIEAGMLISLAEDGDGVSYIFVPGPFSFDATQILLYEDPKHFQEGVLVGFADAHVEMIDHETFERMLAEQLATQSSP